MLLNPHHKSSSERSAMRDTDKDTEEIRRIRAALLADNDMAPCECGRANYDLTWMDKCHDCYGDERRLACTEQTQSS